MVELRRGGTTVVLDDLGQSLQITRIESAAGYFEFDPWPLFVIRLRRASGDGYETSPVFPGSYPVEVVDQAEDRVVLHWAVHNAAIDSLNVVTVTIWIDDREEVNLHIRVINRLVNVSVNRVQFPIMRVRTIGDPESNVLAMPWQGGGVIINPAAELVPANVISALQTTEFETDYPHPSMAAPMQFFAFYRTTGEMLYFQTYDGTGYRKDFTIGSLGDSILFSHHAWPVNNARPGNDPDQEAVYDLPYAIGLTVIEGGWYQAARRYREWALQQRWAKRGLIHEAPDFSPRIRNAAISLLQWAAPPDGSEYDLDRYAEEAIEAKAFLETEALETAWFDWHVQPFDVAVPEWTPRPSFLPALRKTQEHGIGVIPYTLIPQWDPRSKFYADHAGAQFGVRTESDQLVGLSANLVSISPIHQAARELIVAQWSPLATSLNVDGLYLDAWGGGAIALDHNTELAKNGGTTAFAQGKRALTQHLKDAVKGWDRVKYAHPARYLASEFIDELMLDLLEVSSSAPFIFTPYVSFRSVPMFAVVYHEYQMADELIDPAALVDDTLLSFFLARLAFIFHAGRLITLLSLGRNSAGRPASVVHQTPFTEFWTFLKVLIERHSDTYKYQRVGERLAPLQGSFEFLVDRQMIIPDASVQSSVWGADGDIGILISSSAPEARDFVITMQAGSCPLSSRVGLLRVDSGGRRTLLGLFKGSLSHTVRMLPMSLQILEVMEESKAIAATSAPGQAVFGRVALQLDDVIDFAECYLGPFEVAGPGPFTCETLVGEVSTPSTLTFYAETSNDLANWKAGYSNARNLSSPGVLFDSPTVLGGRWVRIHYTLSPWFILGPTVVSFSLRISSALKPPAQIGTHLVPET